MGLPMNYIVLLRRFRRQRTSHELTFTIAVRFNRDSHRSPTTPTAQTAMPVAKRPPRLIPPIENTSSSWSDEPATVRSSGPNNRRDRAPWRANVVAVPRTTAPVTPTHVLFGLATVRREGVCLPVAACCCCCGCNRPLPCRFRRRTLKAEPAKQS